MTDRNRFLQVEPCRVPTSLHTTMGHAQRPSMYRLNHRKMWMSSRQLLFEGFHRRLLNFALELCLQLRSILKRQIFDKYENKYLEMLYDRTTKFKGMYLAKTDYSNDVCYQWNAIKSTYVYI